MLPVSAAHELEERGDANRWLITTLWARAAVGILGGAPKTCKSWLGLEMAVSVASATPCLGELTVGDPGPALGVMRLLAKSSEQFEGMAQGRDDIGNCTNASHASEATG